MLGLTAVAGLLVSVAPAAARAQAAPDSAACPSIVLPVPNGTTESSVNGGAPTGRYLVGVGFHVGGAEGLLWVNDQLTPVDQSPLAPFVQVEFNAVNNHGVLVGERLTDYSGHTDAFVYRGGRFTLLPAPDQGDSTEAVAINSRGDIVGDALSATGVQPVEWPANRPGTVRVLATAGGGSGSATGVDENGTAVGYLGFSPTGVPYVWPATGAAYALPIPAGSAGGTAAAIRLGMVGGDVFDPATGSTEAALWNLRTGSLTTFPTEQGATLSVNRSGTLGVAGGAIVHADGRVVPIAGWPHVVTDRGTAAGATSEFNGQAVRWPSC